MVLRKEAERCTRCRRRGWRRSSEALRRRCRRPALCGPLAGILLLVTARHGDPRRRVPPRRRRDPQLRRHFRFGWAGTQDGASQAWNLQLRSPETGTHAYGTYWRGPTLTVRGPTVAIPPPYSPYSGRKSRARVRKARPLGPRRSRAAWRHGGPTRSPSRCGAARQCSHGRRRLLVAGCARSLCMSLAPIVAAAPMTAAASPRHSSRMRGAAAAAPRTSLRPCGRVRPRAERLPARSMPAVVSAIKKDPYSSPTLPTRVGRVGEPWSGRCRE